MPGDSPARPGAASRARGGVPHGGKHQKAEKWERVPGRSSLLLRFFFVLMVASIAALVVAMHLLGEQPAATTNWPAPWAH